MLIKHFIPINNYFFLPSSCRQLRFDSVGRIVLSISHGVLSMTYERPQRLVMCIICVLHSRSASKFALKKSKGSYVRWTGFFKPSSYLKRQIIT